MKAFLNKVNLPRLDAIQKTPFLFNPLSEAEIKQIRLQVASVKNARIGGIAYLSTIKHVQTSFLVPNVYARLVK